MNLLVYDKERFMDKQILLHGLLILDIIGGVLFLRYSKVKSLWILGALGFMAGVNMYHYVRLFWALYISNPNGWNDLIYSVLFAYGSFALLGAFGVIWIYQAFKRKA
jgi:hypothetical protein